MDGGGGGELELTLNRGIVQVGGSEVALSGAAVVAAGGVVSASFTGDATLDLPGGATGFTVGASYVAATSTFDLALSRGTVEVAGSTVTLEGAARVSAGQVTCLSLRSTGALATIGDATFEVGARLATAGFQCDWMDEPAAAHTFEVTLAGDVVIGGATFGFAGAGRVEGGALTCAELQADGDVALSIAEARFDVGIRYAGAGATCTWDDGTETSADAATLLAALKNGELVVGGASLRLSGTGQLEGGELTCAELEAGGGATFDVGGVSFAAGARFAAAGATCAWMETPAEADTLEATLHDGRIAVDGATLVMSGAAEVAGGKVRCADLTIDAGSDLAFGGIAFTGGGRFIGAGATCDGESAARDTLRLTLEEGAVEIAGTRVTLRGSGEVVGGRVQCIDFAAAGASPELGDVAVTVSAFYAAAGATCAGAPGLVSEDTFALSLALSAGPFAMNGLGRIEGGSLACAELNASGGGQALAGVSFDVGARYTAAGRSCTWNDGDDTVAADKDVFVATLRNGSLAVGNQVLALEGEGELVGGAITCASLEAMGSLAIDVGGVSFAAGARYAAAGESCGWSDGASARLQLTLHDGQVAVGGAEVTLSGSAEIAGRKLTCATFASTAAATVDVGGLSFGVGARYAAAGEACGWSDGSSERFELTLDDGVLTVGGNTFTLSGSARLEDRAVTCAELQSSGALALGGTTFSVGGRYVAAGATCGWSDGTRSSATINTLSVYLSGGSITVAGHRLELAGLGVVRGGKLACASLEASASLDMDVAGVSFALGGARFVGGGETCEWADGTRTSAVADTFSLALRDGRLTVGSVTLTLSGAADIVAGKVACAELQAGGNTRLDVGGVSFAAGARFAAVGSTCGWSDGAANVLEVTLDDGRVDVGGAQLGLRGAAAIAGGKLTCADFDVTAGAAVAFGGVAFDAGARFAAAGESCGWSDGARNTLELTLADGAIDVGGASVRLSGSGVVSGGKLACATLASTASGTTAVGGLSFTVSGRFAARGQTCSWATAPAAANTFELALDDGRLAVGNANLSLSGSGTVAGGRLTCAELSAAGDASAAVGGVAFDLGARYAAAGETCAWGDGSTTTGTTSTLLLALKNGSLTVGGQRLTLSGTATLENKTIACAELDAVGAANVSVGGLSFDAGARYAAAGHACPWTDGAATANTLELTLRDGQISAGDAALRLSGSAAIAAGKVTCADLAVDSDAALAFGGVAFDARARFAAAGATCGWRDADAAAADTLELVLDGASVTVGTTRVALTGSGQIVAGRVRCVTFGAAGQASLGGLTFDVGARFAAAGAVCDWTDGAVAANTFEVTLGGASVTVDGVGALTLSGAGRIEGGALTCAEVGATGDIDVGGVTFDLGARFTKAGTTCTWADGTATTATANTFTFALMNGELAVGPTTLTLSGAATLVGGKLACADLDAAGAASLDVGGVTFAAGARYAAADKTCTWRDGSTTTAASSTLALALRDGALDIGATRVKLAGRGEIANRKLTCATFEIQAGSTFDLGGVAFEAGARYAARGETCGWSDGAANTFELTLERGALAIGDANVELEGSATIAGGALACADLHSSGGLSAGFGGMSFTVGARYAAAGTSCGGEPAPAANTFVVTLDDGRLALGPTTLALTGSGTVAGGKLTCAELDAAGSAADATIALGGVSFDAGVRFAAAGSLCAWRDGTTTDATSQTKHELLVALRNGHLDAGGVTLDLAGSGRIFGGQVACAEFDAVGAAPISLAGVSFAAGARYSGAGHACTWADGTTRPAGAQAMQLTLKQGVVTVAGNSLELAGAAHVEGGKLTCAELDSSASIDVGGVSFATGARYVAAGATCTWRDGTSTTSAAARFDLSLKDGRLALDGVAITLAGSGTLVGGKLACADLRSTGAASASVGGVSFDIGARFAAAGATCAWSPGQAADTFEVTLANGQLAVDGAALSLAGTAQVVGGKLTCAELQSTANAAVAIGGVSFTAGARYTAAGATCAWSPEVGAGATGAGATGAARFELTLDDGALTVGTTQLTLAGAAAIVGGKLTCAELDAAGDASIDLGDVSFEAGARYSAANETCVFRDGTVMAAAPTANLVLALGDGRVTIGSHAVALHGLARISGGQLTCAELDANATSPSGVALGDVSISGITFDAGARYARAGATCAWRDGSETQADATTFVVTLRDGRFEIGASNLRLSGEASLVGGAVACVTFDAAGAASGVVLDGISFELGARFAGAGATCAWTDGPAPTDRFEVTLADGQLVVGTATVSLSGAASVSGRKLTCAELVAQASGTSTTVVLAGATFDVGARYAAGGAACAWSDGTTSAPARDTLAVRLAGQLEVAGQSMAVSGTGLLEGGKVTCAELAANAGFTAVDLGGVSFSTGARYSAAGARCTWSDGTATTAPAGTYSLELALRDGRIDFAGQTLTLSGTAVLEGGTVTRAELAVGGTVSIAGVTFAASAAYDAAAKTLVLNLDDGTLVAGPVALSLTGTGTIDTATRSVRCIVFRAAGNAAADFAGVTFDVGARYAAAGATCDGMQAPAPAATFEATLDNGTLTLGDGGTVSVSGTGTIVGGRVVCASFSANGDVGSGGSGVAFDGTARYAAAGEGCGWRTPTAEAALAVDLSTTITIGNNVLTLSGAGTLGGGGVDCAELEVTGDVRLAGVTFVAGARLVAADTTCHWSDGTTSAPGPQRLEVVLEDGQLQLADGALVLSGVAQAEKTERGYRVPCAGFDARAVGAWPLGGIAFSAAAHFTAAGRQCPWDAAPVTADTVRLALDDGALAVGDVTIGLSGDALVSAGAVRCLELDADGAAKGFAGITFDVGARFAARDTRCQWADGSAETYTATTFAVRLTNGTVNVGAQSVALSGDATVVGGKVACATLEAAGNVSVTLADTTFAVDAHYAAAGATCPWRDAPPAANTFTLALAGDISIDGARLALTGDATLVGGAVQCATFTSAGSLAVGGLTFDGGARYAAAGAQCGWNDDTTGQHLQVALNDGQLDLGTTRATVSGYADLVAGRLDCAHLAVSGDFAATFGGVAMSAEAHYAAAGRTCNSPDGTSTTGPSFTLAMRGDAEIGGNTVALEGTGTIVGRAVKCVTFDAGAAAADAELGGLAVSVAATWAAANTTCGDIAAASTSSFKVRLSGDFTVGPTTARVSGLAALTAGKLTCVDLAAQGNATVALGSLDVALAARFAAAGATCAWPDGTTSAPLANTLYASLSGTLQVGSSSLALRGNGLVDGGHISCAELVTEGRGAFGPQADVSLAGIAFEAAARYSAAGAACTWADGSTSPAPTAATLALALHNGHVEIGNNIVTLAGTAEIDRATGLTCASFETTGAIGIAGITFAGSARYAAANRDCGPWDWTQAEIFQIAVEDGTLAIDGQTVSISGALDVVNRRVSTGTLIIDGALSFAGLTVSGLPGTPAGTLAYAAYYRGTALLASETLRLAVAGRATVAGLGSVDLSGEGLIVDRRLDAITLHLGGGIDLADVQVSAQSLALLYERQNPAAGNVSTLELVLDGGALTVTGLGALAVNGRSLLVAGALSELSLDITTDFALAGLTVSGGGSLLYRAADRTLTLTLADARANVPELGSLSLSGSATLTGGALDALTLDVGGDLRLGGATLEAAATLTFLRSDPSTGRASLALTLSSARADIVPLGHIDFAGRIALDGGTLASFALTVTSEATLVGVPLSGGLSLSYRHADRTLSFAVDRATATVAGLGALEVSGSATIAAGTLGALSLRIAGNVSLAGVTLVGASELAYDALDRTLTLAVNDASVTVEGLDATIEVAGSARLSNGRLSALSLAVAGGASLQGLALAGTVTLDYVGTYDVNGNVLSRSLSLALTDATVALPDASVSLAGRLDIVDGAVACATLGPADAVISGVSFEASATYIAAGQTCGVLPTPAASRSFTARFGSLIDVAGVEVSVSGFASVSAGRIDSIQLAATLALDGLGGLERAAVSADYTGGTLCLAGDVEGTLTLPLGAELRSISARFCANGMHVAAVDFDMYVIAPNAVGEPLPLLAHAGWDGAASALDAALCLASEDVAGDVCCTGSAGCSPAAWHPFDGGVLPGLPGDWGNLSVTALSGSVAIGGGKLSIEALGAIDGSALPQLVPGLALKNLDVWLRAQAGGGDTGAAAGISGLFSLPLGEQPVDVSLQGTFAIGSTSGLALTLAGAVGDRSSGVSANVEPLRQFIGENTFEISYLDVTLAASTSAGISFTLGGGANITLPAPVSVGPIGLQLEGHGAIGKRTGFYVTGGICGIALPAGILPEGFDAIPLGGPSPCATPLVAVALASRAFPDVDIAPNTPIRRGLTLATTIPVPPAVARPLGLEPATANPPPAPSRKLPALPSIVAELGVDTSGIRLKGALNIPWQVIRPDWNLPAVRLLQLNQLAFQIEINSAPTLSFTGNVLFQPNHCLPDYQSFVEAGLASDDSPFVAFDPSKIRCLDLPAPFRAMPQQTTLTGKATFRYRPPKEFGGEIYLHGMWYEPFWIPNIGIASPGMTLDIRLVDGPYGIQIPVPTSLGVNGDVFWKRPYYDDTSAQPTYPIACTTNADCTGFGNCSGSACPARCEDGPDGDTLPDTCRYTWPYTCAAPDPAAPDAACIDTQFQPADVPHSLASGGMTFFYDVYPKPSGIAIPLPTLIVRRELNNLDTLDLIPAVNELKDGARNLFRWMEDRVPGVSSSLSPFPPCVDLDGDGTLDKSLSCIFPADPLPNILQDVPVGIALDKARIYLSTHERELFGVTFNPGIRADLDAKLTVVGAPTCDADHPCTGGLTCDNGTCKRVVFMAGSLGPAGLSLEGRASPVNILDAVTIKGDPFTKFADTQVGHVEVATDPALEPLPGTVEAWVLPRATTAWQSVLRHVGAAGNGFELSVGAPQVQCNARYADCDGPASTCARLTCLGAPGAANELTAACSAGGSPGTCSACAPDAATPNAPCSVPCTSDAECTASTGLAGSTCIGAVPYNPDADTLAAASAEADFDLAAVLAASAATCPQDAGLDACTAAAVRSALDARVGTPLSNNCATCLADFVSCAELATVRVDVLRAGVVTRTVRTATPLVDLAKWSHLAVSFDDTSDDIALYVGGAAVATDDDSGRPACGASCGCKTVCADPQSSECTTCAGALFPDLAHAAAVSQVAAACTSCDAALDTWLANADGAGHWATPGLGATVRMAAPHDAFASIASIDDVRIWATPRTPDQIAANTSSLPQDATPETLGDCSNAGPGTCTASQKRCDADFDCPAGACVGAIPTGTCRSDDDCDDDATCSGFVPSTQRWAFADDLVARWEFDYDSYQSGLGRAWNTRYRGDPSGQGVDCVATPELPPTDTCGLIGQPCKDYDLTASYKLHGRYLGGAAWRTAIDTPGASHADDISFSLKVPFSSKILSDAGLGIRGGVAFTFPDDLPLPDLLTNGGARIDVAVAGTKQAEGSLYAKPFDLLGFGLCSASTTACTTHADCDDPVFGLDDIAYCRDDGFCTAGACLARLTLSGYGPNGIDDGIDDGFYARTNLHAKPFPTLQAGARVSVESFATPRDDLAFASYDVGCPPGESCQSVGDYRFSLATGLQLDIPLPFSLKPNGDPTHLLKVCGNAVTYKPGKGDATPDWVTASRELCPDEGQIPAFGSFVDGSIDVLDQTFSGSALLTNCGFKIRSTLDVGRVHIGDMNLPSLATMSTDITGRFMPFRICSEGYLAAHVDIPPASPLKLLELDAEVTADVCFGDATKYPGKDSGNFMRLQTGSADGTPTPATLKFLSATSGASLFEAHGTADLCLGNGDLVGAPGVEACADDYLKLCGGMQLLDGLVTLEDKCFEIHVPHLDVVFSIREGVPLDFDGVLPSSNSEVMIEMCPKGQNAAFNEAAGRVICQPHANPGFKMTVPFTKLRFRSSVDVAGAHFGNVDMRLVTRWDESALRLEGVARYDGTSTPPTAAFGLDAWAPEHCDMSIGLVIHTNAAPELTVGRPNCYPYCLADSDCSESGPGAFCALGKCQVCGDDACAFGENSLNCPQDCGYPAGTSCPDDDDYCASGICWSVAEQLPFLVDLGAKRDPGVCLPCLPGVTDCGPGKYCDGFQFFECRDKAPWGAYCAMNSACASDKCQFDLLWGGPRCAECTDSNQCGNNEWCDTYPSLIPTAPDYKCHPRAQTGEKCGVGPYIGATDGNCAPGNFCDVDGTCHAKAPADVICTGDRVCASDNCCFEGLGVCEECCNDGDCTGGKWCDTYLTTGAGHPENLVSNTCRGPAPTGGKCGLLGQDHHCQAGNFCDADGTCHAKAQNGTLCLANNACVSGHCTPYIGNAFLPTCVGGAQDAICSFDSDCGPEWACHDLTCKKGNPGWHCQLGANDCQPGLYCNDEFVDTCRPL